MDQEFTMATALYTNDSSDFSQISHGFSFLASLQGTTEFDECASTISVPAEQVIEASQDNNIVQATPYNNDINNGGYSVTITTYTSPPNSQPNNCPPCSQIVEAQPAYYQPPVSSFPVQHPQQQQLMQPQTQPQPVFHQQQFNHQPAPMMPNKPNNYIQQQQQQPQLQYSSPPSGQVNCTNGDVQVPNIQVTRKEEDVPEFMKYAVYPDDYYPGRPGNKYEDSNWSANVESKPRPTKSPSSHKGSSNRFNPMKSSPTSSTNESKNNGGRTRFTIDQLEVLEMYFARDNRPEMAAREDIAEELGVNEYSIRIWFKNRRARPSRLENVKKRLSNKSMANGHSDRQTHSPVIRKPPQPERIRTATIATPTPTPEKTPIKSTFLGLSSFQHGKSAASNAEATVSTGRTSFTEDQVQRLEKIYQVNNRPEVEELGKISDELELRVEVLKNWFKNRRARSNQNSGSGKKGRRGRRKNSTKQEQSMDVNLSVGSSSGSESNESSAASPEPCNLMSPLQSSSFDEGPDQHPSDDNLPLPSTSTAEESSAEPNQSPSSPEEPGLRRSSRPRKIKRRNSEV